MGREIAGVFGYVAFATVSARGLLVGAAFDETVKLALMMLFAFAGVGFVVGSIAQQTIRESVLQAVREPLEDENNSPNSNLVDGEHAAGSP